MLMNSKVRVVGETVFPDFAYERHYMVPFTLKSGLPDHLKHWQLTVDLMLQKVDTDEEIYLMVDQSFVKQGNFHRRPGVHVDMYWHPAISAHGEPGHISTPPKGRHRGGHGHLSYGTKEAIILASSDGCARAYQGNWDLDLLGQGGDCSSVDVSKLHSVNMQAGVVYAGDTMSMLHESLPVKEDTLRTLVRLNVKGWLPH